MGFAVSLGKDGCIAAQGDISSVLSEVGRQVDEEQTIDEDIIPEEEDTSTDETPSTSVSNVTVKPSSNGKLIVAEEISRGRVRWPASKFLASNVSIKIRAQLFFSKTLPRQYGRTIAYLVLDNLPQRSFLGTLHPVRSSMVPRILGRAIRAT